MMVLCVHLKEIIKFKMMVKSKSLLVGEKISTTHLESNLQSMSRALKVFISVVLMVCLLESYSTKCSEIQKKKFTLLLFLIVKNYLGLYRMYN